jgi:hypothetical protein
MCTTVLGILNQGRKEVVAIWAKNGVGRAILPAKV